MAYKFSPSSLKLLKECPRCFWLTFRKGIKRPIGIMPSLPNGMDILLKKHFDRFMELGKLPPEISHLDGCKLFDDAELLKVWRNNFKGIQWKDADGNVLRGAVDNILVKGKKLIVLDYKTRGFPVKEDGHEYYIDQLALYTFLLQKNGYSTEDYAYLLFYHPTHIHENGAVDFQADLVRVDVDVVKAEAIVAGALSVLGGEEPGANEKCGYCGNGWGTGR